MNKILYTFFILTVFAGINIANAEGVFDSMDTASEIKLAPTVKATSSNSSSNLVVESPATNIPAASTKSAADKNTVPAVQNKTNSIKEQNLNNALVNLDDAQVELRQELSAVNAKYNQALDEKDRIIANCKNLKREIKDITSKMKNIEKSKKIINKNLDNAQ